MTSSDDSMPAMPSALIYIQDADGYVGQHLVSAIKSRNAFWDSGAEIPAPNDDDPTEFTRRLVLYDPAGKTLDQCVADADIIVVNLFGDLDQAAALIKAARNITPQKPKHVVCLSTALTWAGATYDGDGADETQFRRRQPAAACSRQKLLETLVVNSPHDSITTSVIAAGVLYGDGERDFHLLFKQAWMGSHPALPVIGAGANTIPTVHVVDFASAAVRFIERPPPGKPYVLITDKSRDTQQAIVTAISQTLSTGAIDSVSELDAVVRRDLIDLHIATANMLVARDTSWIAALEMEWRCEKGLVESIISVVEEFIAVRDLRPLRVVVFGPPGSGRSFWAQKIAARFYLPIVSIRDLIANAKQTGADVQLDKTGRAPVSVIAALVQAELNRNEIRNKGYVLDGYPRTSEEARATFDVKPASSDSDPPAAADPDQDSSPAKTRNVSIIPERVVSLSITDALALSRAKENAVNAVGGHSDEKGLQRRLTAWNKLMASSADNHPRSWFVTSGTLEILDVNGADSVEIIEDLVMAYVTGLRPPFNYHPTDGEIAAAQAAKQERERLEREQEQERERQHQLQLEREAQEHARKAAESQALLQHLAQIEAEQIAERARPLRQYLDQHVVPVVVEGLYEIARVRPDDPIDYLAEFLFRASTTTTSSSSLPMTAATL